jgi:hypothetical protein
LFSGSDASFCICSNLEVRFEPGTSYPL